MSAAADGDPQGCSRFEHEYRFKRAKHLEQSSIEECRRASE